MKIVVWVVSGLLALAFLFIGGIKVMMPMDALQAGGEGVPALALKTAGIAEVLGAIGLILPAATRILPVLTPIAAVGLVVTMIGATTIDTALGHYSLAAMTAVLGLLAAFVAWARFGPAKVAPRGSGAARTSLDPA